MPKGTRFFYGSIAVHPIFVELLGDRGVQFSKSIDLDALHRDGSECVTLLARYPEAVQDVVEAVAACSGGSIILSMSLVDHAADLGNLSASNSPQRLRALERFHQFCIEAVAADSDRELHRRALARLQVLWVKSIRQSKSASGTAEEPTLGGPDE